MPLRLFLWFYHLGLGRCVELLFIACGIVLWGQVLYANAANALSIHSRNSKELGMEPHAISPRCMRPNLSKYVPPIL